MPSVQLLDKAIDMYNTYYPEELNYEVYNSCEKGDPSGRARSIHVVRYIANTYSNNGTTVDDLHADTIGLSLIHI